MSESRHTVRLTVPAGYKASVMQLKDETRVVVKKTDMWALPKGTSKQYYRLISSQEGGDGVLSVEESKQP